MPTSAAVAANLPPTNVDKDEGFGEFGDFADFGEFEEAPQAEASKTEVATAVVEEDPFAEILGEYGIKDDKAVPEETMKTEPSGGITANAPVPDGNQNDLLL